MPGGWTSNVYKANVSVVNLTDANNVIANPSQQTWTKTETAPYINYMASGADGHFYAGAAAPGNVANRAVPGAGDWTFGVNSDDGFRLTIVGATFTSQTNATAITGNTLEYDGGRGPADTFGVITGLAPGEYDLRLAYWEGGGGNEVELFAAPGSYTSWRRQFPPRGRRDGRRPQGGGSHRRALLDLHAGGL